MSDSATSRPGIPSPADPAVVAAIDRWVAAATDDTAAALAAVVHRVATAHGIHVDFTVDGVPVPPDTDVSAIEVTDSVLDVAGPWLPGFVREALLVPASRRRAGVHHTSPEMARALLDFVAGLHAFGGSTVVADPAVGGGVFLLAACEQLPGTPEERVQRVMGFDIDPLAVAVTEASLRLWSGGAAPRIGAIQVGDALLSAEFAPRPNVIVGNPPFLSQLRDDTTRDGERRSALRARWPEVGGYVDDAAAFLLASVDHVVDGGVVALVQPTSFLSARDAAPVRARLATDAPPIGLWIDGDRQFEAAVDTVAVVVRKGVDSGPIHRSAGVPAVELSPHAGPLPSASWAALLLDDSIPQLHEADVRRDATVGDVAGVTAGFRDQFYGLRGAVTEDEHAEHRLITSGLIDPLECRWGTTTCRFDRTKWLHPAVDPAAVTPEIRDWIADRLRPKLLVASQTKVIEVVVDAEGVLVPCTPVVSVEPTPEAPTLAHLAAALTSPVAALLLLAKAAGSALSRDAMRVSATTIAALPLPVAGADWDVAAAAVNALDPLPDRAAVIEIGRLGLVAYGLGERADILNWWQQRLPRR